MIVKNLKTIKTLLLRDLKFKIMSEDFDVTLVEEWKSLKRGFVQDTTEKAWLIFPV